LLFSHRSLELCSFFQVLFSLCSLHWVISIYLFFSLIIIFISVYSLYGWGIHSDSSDGYGLFVNILLDVNSWFTHFSVCMLYFNKMLV
jgi:hypothetical protein